MGNTPSNALEVRVRWASHHIWPSGYQQMAPSSAHSLWLMVEGEAIVDSGEKHWSVPAGSIFLWPKDQQRHVSTPQGAEWLSLGLTASTAAQTDVLDLLPAPALHLFEPSEGDFVQSWIRQIIELRYALTQTSEENRKQASYFDSLERLWTQPTYNQWLNQLVAERPAHFDELEAGLARAIVAWCWKLWGTTSFESALHHQSPEWLQKTLERIREHPDVHIGDLAHAAGFSPAQFRRTFHQKMGQSPSDYVQGQRLEKARRLLEDTDTPISEVAAKAGFASVSHFVRLWKSATGLPPLQYRLSVKQANI